MNGNNQNLDKKDSNGMKNISKFVLASQYILLIALAVAVGYLLYLNFVKNPESSGVSVVSILEVLVAILILIGFELMIHNNAILSQWMEKWDKIDTRVDNLENNLSDIQKLSPLRPRIDELLSKINKPFFLTETSKFFHIYQILSKSFGYVYEEYKKSTVSGDVQKEIRNGFYKAHLFAKFATGVFLPLDSEETIKKNKSKVFESISFLHNIMTASALETMKLRKAVSEEVHEYVIIRMDIIKRRLDEGGLTNYESEKYSKELKELELIKKTEEEIREHLSKVIYEMEKII